MHVNGLKQAKRDPNPQVSDVNVPKQGVRIRTEKEFSEEETYGAKIKGPRAVPAHAASHFHWILAPKSARSTRRGKQTDAKEDGFSRMGVSGAHE